MRDSQLLVIPTTRRRGRDGSAAVEILQQAQRPVAGMGAKMGKSRQGASLTNTREYWRATWLAKSSFSEKAPFSAS
jgi:nucleoid-associated protein YgaU